MWIIQYIFLLYIFIYFIIHFSWEWILFSIKAQQMDKNLNFSQNDFIVHLKRLLNVCVHCLFSLSPSLCLSLKSLCSLFPHWDQEQLPYHASLTAHSQRHSPAYKALNGTCILYSYHSTMPTSETPCFESWSKWSITVRPLRSARTRDGTDCDFHSVSHFFFQMPWPKENDWNF